MDGPHTHVHKDHELELLLGLLITINEDMNWGRRWAGRTRELEGVVTNVYDQMERWAPFSSASLSDYWALIGTAVLSHEVEFLKTTF